VESEIRRTFRLRLPHGSHGCFGGGEVDVVQLSEFLAQAGYRRIPLQRSGVGHFHAPGSLRDRVVSVLVDTGAGCTLVSLALARELGLSLTLLEGI